MIIKRLRYLAVSLLVLLCVVSVMGGFKDEYKYLASEADPTVCLSLRSSKLTDCCRQDDMQRIHVTKTGPSTGIFHIRDYKKVLCYDKNRMKFKPIGRNALGLKRCRHPRRRRHREGRRRHWPICSRTLTREDKKRLQNMGCELHANLGAGSQYISAESSGRYLGMRKGRVQKHLKRGKLKEPKEKNRRFVMLTESDMKRVQRPCGP